MNTLSPRADPLAPKLLGLEVLRFLSALAVLVWHYQHFWFMGTDLPAHFVRSDQPLYPFFRLFYEWGVYGVQVFWFISGYIFFWKYLASIRDRQVSGWRFFVLRASRLYPLHLLTFALVAALQWAHHAHTGRFHVYPANDAYHAFLQLFMASHWGLQQAESFNGPIWSVSLEVLAYLGFFVFARWVAVRGHTALCVAAVALVSAVAFQLKMGPVFQCLFCFFVGGLVVLWGETAFARTHRRAIAVAAVAYVIGLALACRALNLFDRKLVVHLYITTATPLLLHLLATEVRLSGWLARWAATAGNTTYASYLLHFPLQLGLVLWATATGWVVPRDQPIFFLAYLGVSLALGMLTFRYFEMPMQDRLRRIASTRAPPSTAVAPAAQGR